MVKLTLSQIPLHGDHVNHVTGTQFSSLTDPTSQLPKHKQGPVKPQQPYDQNLPSVILARILRPSSAMGLPDPLHPLPPT